MTEPAPLTFLDPTLDTMGFEFRARVWGHGESWQAVAWGPTGATVRGEGKTLRAALRETFKAVLREVRVMEGV